MLGNRIADVVPRGFRARPEVVLRLEVRVVVQAAGADKNHPGAMFRAGIQMAPAGFAEIALFSGGGLEGNELGLAGNELESLFLRDQDRGERRAREFPAVRTMAIREEQQLAVDFVLHRAAVATAFEHIDLALDGLRSIVNVRVLAGGLVRNTVTPCSAICLIGFRLVR